MRSNAWKCNTNMLAITLVFGKIRQRLIGIYLLPTKITKATWNGLQTACMEATDPMWILGNVNVNLHSNHAIRLNEALQSNTDQRSVEVQAFLAMGVESFGLLKLQRRKTGVWTWFMEQTVGGIRQKVNSICDYILGPKTNKVSLYRV
jgi:hypothetical protein